MTAFTPEENARRLEAWNAWKEVCWVHGLGKSRGDLPAVGTTEDEKVLSELITNAFRRKLSPFAAHLEDAQGRFDFSEIDCAEEFDAALYEYEHVDRYKKGFYGDEAKLRKKKAWKDFVWQSVAASDDPPLQVIMGKLLGRSGVINQIVEEWLLSNFSCRQEGSMLVFDRSRDLQIEKRGEVVEDGGDIDGCEPNERLVIDCISPRNEDADGAADGIQSVLPLGEDVPKRRWREELEQAFPSCLCCLLFAYMNGVKVYADKEVLDALGIGKTTAAEELKTAPGRMDLVDPELRNWIKEDAEGREFFAKWIKERCLAEKAGQIILSRMMDSTNAFV